MTNTTLRGVLARWIGAGVVASSALCGGLLQAATITAGTPISGAVPDSLVDSLVSLGTPATLPAGALLVPIEVTAADGLQDWSFDLLFDYNVVELLDLGGLYPAVYAALFSASDPTSSEITSSGLPLDGVLDGIAGFSSGASGDGLLAYVLFQYRAGVTPDPNELPEFDVRVGDGQQQVPEPATPLLVAIALLAVGLARRAPPLKWAAL